MRVVRELVRVGSVAGLVALLLTANRVDADVDPPRARSVSFLGPLSECPSEASLDGRVKELLGPGLPEGVFARVEVQQGTEGYHVTVTILSPRARGERHFTSPTCALAVETAAVIVAISMDPSRARDLSGHVIDAEGAAAL